MNSSYPKNLLFPALVGCLNASILAFIGLFFAPKVIAFHELFRSPDPLPGWCLPINDWSTRYQSASLILAAIFAAYVLVYLPKFTRKWRSRFADACIYGLSLACTLAVPFQVMAVFVGTQSILVTQELRLKNYSAVLEEFALTQTAERRVAFAEEIFRRLNGEKLVEIKDPTSLALWRQKEELSRLIEASRVCDESASQKRILATIALFRSTVEADAHMSGLVLKRANAITGQNFSTSKDLFDWLETKKADENWKPVPIFQMD
jgi:hypothetical protein